MSLRPMIGRRLGASAAPLIACLILVLVGGVIIAMMYSKGQDYQAELDKAIDDLKAKQAKLAQESGNLEAWEEAVALPMAFSRCILSGVTLPPSKYLSSPLI